MYKKIAYSELSPKQQEIYNFQKVAGILAEYGFNCIKLSNDWNGADFLAYHFNQNKTLKVQLKGRVTIRQKYLGKGIYMAFPIDSEWHLIKHDELVKIIRECTKWLDSDAWNQGGYDSGKPSRELKRRLNKYKLLS